jgi:hypothetical protein
VKALELMVRMESGERFAPNRDKWISECHDDARDLNWTERAAFCWACECARCKRGTRPNGEYEMRDGERYEVAK